MKNKDLPYKNKGDLTTGPIPRHLVRLTLPMIWGILAVISVQLVDTYFIALLGTTELAGISFTFPVTMLISHLVFGMNVAISSVVSRMIGEKKADDAKRVTLHALMMALLVSGFVSLTCYTLLQPIFRLLGAQDTVMPVILEYMPLWLVASAILALPVSGNSAMRAAGDTFIPAVIMITLALINMILDPILIFGLLGAPALGVKGAAMATLTAYCIGAVMGLYALVFRKKLVPADGFHLRHFGDSVRRLAVIAVPAGITNTIMPITNAVIIALLAVHGEEVVAAFGVATRIEAFALLAVISLSLGMAPIVGQNWGAQKYERVHETINLSIGFNFAWSFMVALILGLFAQPIAGAFSDDPVVVKYTVLFFWIVPFSYAFSNLVFGWASAFNAMGMPQRAFVMITVKALVLLIPAVYTGSWIAGTTGIFVAIALANLAAGVIFHIVSWRACLRCEHTDAAAAAT